MLIPEDRFKNYLKKKKMKFTPERKSVLEGVFSLHGHFDAEELYERMKKQNKHTSLASIYRTIPLLVESGLINESIRIQGRVKYEHIFGHDHHDHLLCIKCGKIIEFKEKNIEKLQKVVCRKYGFKPVKHKLGIRGYCRKCR